MKNILTITSMIFLTFTSLTSAAREITDEQTLLRKMDFPSGKPLFGSSSAEKKKITELWDDVNKNGKFQLVGTKHNDEKKTTTEQFLSVPKPVEVSNVWVEAWQKTASKYDDGDGSSDYAKVKSSATRYLINCQEGSLIMAASLFFASSDASGEPANIYPWYQSPPKYTIEKIRGSAFEGVYNKACYQ